MKGTTKLAIGIGAALSLGLGAAVVNAHPYGYGPGWGMGGGMGSGMGGGWGPGSMGGHGMGMGGRGMGMANPTAAIEGRLAYQKAQLKITPAQENAWQAYANVARKQAEAMQNSRNTVLASPPATAAERLELHNKIMKDRLAQFEATNAAFKTLYAQLTPEQRAIADDRAVAFGAGMHGPGGRSR